MYWEEYMSECVVRMELPSNCWVCPFGMDGYIWNENDARTHYVRFCSRHSDEEYHVLEIDTIDRPWYCDSFICSIPEGHGRLIDADKIDYYEVERFGEPHYMVWKPHIDGLPTIVPAERRET